MIDMLVDILCAEINRLKQRIEELEQFLIKVHGGYPDDDRNEEVGEVFVWVLMKTKGAGTDELVGVYTTKGKARDAQHKGSRNDRTRLYVKCWEVNHGLVEGDGVL